MSTEQERQLNEHAQRFDRIEVVLDKLIGTQVEDRNRITRIESLMETVVTSQRMSNDKLDKLGGVVASSGKLNQGMVVTMVAVGGLLITIGGLWTAPTNKKLDEHVLLDGHGPAMEIHAANTEKFNTIESRLDEASKTEDRLRERLNKQQDEIVAISGRVTAVEASRVDTHRILPIEERLVGLEARIEYDRDMQMMRMMQEIAEGLDNGNIKQDNP